MDHATRRHPVLNLDVSFWLALVLLIASAVLLKTVEMSVVLGLVVGLAPAVPIAVRFFTMPAEQATALIDVECVRISRRVHLAAIGSAVFAASALLTSSWLLRNFEFGAAAGVAVALLPVLPWTAFLLAQVYTLSHLDELQRRIQLDAVAMAFAGAVVLVMTVERVQKAGFWLGVDATDFWVWMIMLYVPAYLVARLRYR